MEIKTPIYTRVPPGDRWVEISGDAEYIIGSLTEAIEHQYQKTGTRQYYIDAAAGYIYRVDEVADTPVVAPRYSIYDDII
jgi:hypothetical protein